MKPARIAIRVSSPWLFEPLLVLISLLMLGSAVALALLSVDRTSASHLAVGVAVLLASALTSGFGLLLALEITDFGRERRSQSWLMMVLHGWAAIPLAARLIAAHGILVLLAQTSTVASNYALRLFTLVAVLVFGLTGRTALRCVQAMRQVSDNERESLWALGAALPRTGVWIATHGARRHVWAALHLGFTEVWIEAAALSALTLNVGMGITLGSVGALSWLASHYTIWRARCGEK